MEQNKDRHVMVDDVVEYLKDQGTSVGKSTVYRYLEKLVEEGLCRKYFLEEGKGACFQLSGDDGSCHRHYHLKCVVCGQLLHVECSYLDEVEAHILAKHQFHIDSSKTVLYGVCGRCAEQRRKEESL
ncbi:Fur family transcriptional regulator [Zongyangia hominis]|uniref:Fur family transcriptional regulator n=1 Tax=Zongyangia hominis TaxID=2763677 RepID=UPI0021CCE9BE|nr:transcriptional repressor [Zongyangia hominis]